MRRYLTGGNLMGGVCAALAGAAMVFSLGISPAQAQRGGSFLQTCTNVRTSGNRITADCRRMDGGWNRAVLRDARSCTGDIANMNGSLVCSRGGEGWRRGGRRDWRNYGGSGWDRGNSDYGRGDYAR